MTLRTPQHLIDAGLADSTLRAELEAVAARYAVAITPAVARLIATAPADGPVARQFIPSAAELETRPDEDIDPIGDAAHSPVPGIVHRYPDRVLLKATAVCPVYCRYCFRREMVGPANGAQLTSDQLEGALGYIRDTPGIWEVILTGGDPLILSPRRIREISDALARIEHVKVIRWHTRVPVVAPDTVTTDLVAALRSGHRQAVWLALHANHPDEFTGEARAAVARLVDGGIPLVSQTVLLAGINDTPATLAALMRAFVENRVKPYYLHHLDRPPGTGHFRVPLERGRALLRGLQGETSGLCQPTYVLDIPGGHGKVPIGPAYAETADGSEFLLTDFNGCRHTYRDDA